MMEMALNVGVGKASAEPQNRTDNSIINAQSWPHALLQKYYRKRELKWGFTRAMYRSDNWPNQTLHVISSISLASHGTVGGTLLPPNLLSFRSHSVHIMKHGRCLKSKSLPAICLVAKTELDRRKTTTEICFKRANILLSDWCLFQSRDTLSWCFHGSHSCWFIFSLHDNSALGVNLVITKLLFFQSTASSF